MENKIIFDKLIRDKIAEVIKQNGDIPEVEVLDPLAYSQKLDEKLLEECKELINAKDKSSKMEEMADVLEILYAMTDVLEVTMEEIESIRLTKKEERGAFKKRLLLKSTISGVKNEKV